jgi:hypothetical protein
MKRLAPSIVAVLLAVVPACTSTLTLQGSEEILVVEVAPDSVPCVGEMVGRCIQVRSPGEDAWRKFYDPIDGFRHDAGFRYTLRVARRAVPDPPADGSAWTYRLIEIMEREPGEADARTDRVPRTARVYSPWISSASRFVAHTDLPSVTGSNPAGEVPTFAHRSRARS